MDTGDVEILAKSIKILNLCQKELPINLKARVSRCCMIIKHKEAHRKKQNCTLTEKLMNEVKNG